MATQLPMILDVSTRSNQDGQETQPSSKKARKSSSFLSRLQFGSLQALPQPGDVHYPPLGSKQTRPLGLIPNRNNRLAALKKLNQLLSPWSNQTVPAMQPLASTHTQRQDEVAVPTISASVHHSKASANSAEPTNTMEVDPVAYRLALAGSGGVDGDPDYMGAREYYTLAGAGPLPSVQTFAPGIGQSIGHPSNTHNTHKISSLQRQPPVPTHTNPQYFNFTGQAHLFERPLMEDKRDAVGQELCERCRLRGGRCARCKAIRTGGGYIILDAGQDLEWMLNKRRKGFDFKWTGGPQSMSGGRSGRGGVRTQGDMEGTGPRLDGGGAVLRDSGGGASQKWGGREGGGPQRSAGDDGKGRGGRLESNSGDDREKIGTQAQTKFSKEKGGGTREDSAGGDTGRRLSGHTQPGSHSREAHVRGGVALAATGVERSGSAQSQGGQDGDTSGRQSQASRSTSRQGWSRPTSTRGVRPGSSLKPRPGRGVDQNKRSRSDMEGGQSRTRNSRGGEGSIDMEGEGAKGQRGKHSADEENSRGSYEGPEFKFDHNNGEEELDNDGYHGNLMKFKRKKDNVKVLHATLKELQGIDPLDYLAKYCIIDQAKVPHYQHIFTNVDRDEDDEIDIGELDFALKAVNYDLISDSEMSYVHSVLELAGRYKLNFRLFSLIAALSEKVVALEDTVKRLINKMDFDALEVKMKKCKELFYLLADADEVMEHDGGVVTSRSLAVELQAGGLTQDHVEFVVDRLNHEGKGLVEFLDYLTYVPLFVEIHDAIYGNPLDFSRTK